MNSGNDDSQKVWNAMQNIAAAFRPIVHIAEGSRRLRPIGTAFAVSLDGTRYLITADHVLLGMEDKLMGVDETYSTRWPRSFSRLCPNDASLPDADVAWVAIKMFEDTMHIGTAIPIEQTLAQVAGGDDGGYLAVGQPVSKSRMINAQSVVDSTVMIAQVRKANSVVKAELMIDDRVQMAFTYSSGPHSDLLGQPAVSANPKGLSGGAIVAMTRAQDSQGRSVMKPYVIGVLTRYHPEQRTYVATRITHLWKAIGITSSNDALYHEEVGTYIPAV